jgi:hypothetical protein
VNKTLKFPPLLCSVFSGEFCGDDSGLLLVLEPVALALDVDGGGVVQEAIEDGGCDDVVGEDPRSDT